MHTCDFSRSFLQFHSETSRNTAVIRVAAGCHLTLRDGTSKQFVLTDECIAENMYVSEGLIQPCGKEFMLIAAQNDEFMQIKDAGGSEPDLREAHRFGETMSTQSGRGSKLKSITVTQVHFPGVRLLESDAEICEAIVGNKMLNVRTSYDDPDDGTAVVMDYPVRVSNSVPEDGLWQIDTGRVLALAHGPGNGLLVERLAPAYIVLNSRDRAEVAIMRMSMDGARAAQYSDIRSLNVKNEVFVEEEA